MNIFKRLSFSFIVFHFGIIFCNHTTGVKVLASSIVKTLRILAHEKNIEKSNLNKLYKDVLVQRIIKREFFNSSSDKSGYVFSENALTEVKLQKDLLSILSMYVESGQLEDKLSRPEDKIFYSNIIIKLHLDPKSFDEYLFNISERLNTDKIIASLNDFVKDDDVLYEGAIEYKIECLLNRFYN